MSVILDTGVLVAAIATSDAHHADAISLLRKGDEGTYGAVLTSDFIVAEALNFVQARIRNKSAIDQLLAPIFGTKERMPIVRDVLRVHSGRFAAALDLFRRHFAKGLSFTDCSTLALALETPGTYVATFDGGFRGLVPMAEA
ncbi:MAG: type II toxin-antitoxin system VapC family toxin [Thermoplasmatota archaeon]